MELTASSCDRTLLGITNQYSNGRGPNAHALVRPASLHLAKSGQGICGIAQQDHDLIIKEYELPTRLLSSFQKPWVCPSYPHKNQETAMMLKNILLVLSFTVLVLAHGDHNAQSLIQGPHQSLWYKAFNKIPGDGGTQVW